MLPQIWRTVTGAIYGQSIKADQQDRSRGCSCGQVIDTASKKPVPHFEKSSGESEASDTAMSQVRTNVSLSSSSKVDCVTVPADEKVIDVDALSLVHEKPKGQFREEVALARRSWRESSTAQEVAVNQNQPRGTYRQPLKRSYCPYIGCDYYKIGNIGPVLEHIRRRHMDCPPIKLRCRYIFETPAGVKINFDENSRNLLADGQALVIKTTSSRKLQHGRHASKTDRRFYCPYRICSTETTLSSTFYRHLRVAHSVDLSRVSTSPRKVFITANGTIEFDAKSRNTLSAGQTIHVKLD